jgi:hypothetical protein
LCIERFVEVSLELAAHCRAAGDARQALHASAAALRAEPFSLRAWTALAKCAAYPFMPSGMLALYHRLRAGLQERTPPRA